MNNQLHKHFKLSRKGTTAFHVIILVVVGLAAVGIVLFLGLSARLEEESFSSGILFNSKAPGAELSVVAPKTKYKQGETFVSTVLLSTDGKGVVGVDVQMEYDPSFLELVNVQTGIGGYLVTKNSVFDDFLGFESRPKDGFLTFSALKRPTEEYNGSGEVASLAFRTLKKGNAGIRFVSRPKATVDSNVTSMQGKDILGEVSNLEIEIN
jgi:hypothetical protein